jgi:hypothetical protein
VPHDRASAPNRTPRRRARGRESDREGRGIRCLAIAAAILLLLSCATPAHAYPTSWLHEAHCIHQQETRGRWATRWHLTRTWTGATSRQRGGLQIDEDTWAAFAPRRWTRDPAHASRAQQLFVAWRIWHANGDRWGGNQWPNSSRACGVR